MNSGAESAEWRLREVLGELRRILGRFDRGGPRGNDPKCDRVAAVVAACFGMDEGVMRSGSRLAEVVWARHVTLFFCFEFATPNRSAIGRAFGVDHATVGNALRAVRDRMETRAADRVAVENVRERVRREFPDPDPDPYSIGRNGNGNGTNSLGGG